MILRGCRILAGAPTNTSGEVGSWRQSGHEQHVNSYRFLCVSYQNQYPRGLEPLGRARNEGRLAHDDLDAGLEPGPDEEA